MISTFYSLDTLGSGPAFVAAFVIGMLFGLALERAGFGSSRKLAAVFYFKDMTVIKVMFTAVLVATLGLVYARMFGLIGADSVYLLPTVFGAQLVGGLIFGVGFVVGGWCPGTAAAGVASGKLDALLFLGGVAFGSLLFNELFALVRPLYTAGQRGVRFVYDSLGLSEGVFLILFVLAGVVLLAGCEWIEKARGRANGVRPRLVTALSLVLLALAAAPAMSLSRPGPSQTITATMGEQQLLEQVDQAADHIEPEELADRLARGERDILVVDVRSPEEFAAFHIRGAVNVALAELPAYLEPYRNRGMIVLYSNGMTHPAQARDALARSGFANAYMLTDGLNGFIERCLKPVSLRAEPLMSAQVTRVRQWRQYFIAEAPEQAAPVATSADGKPPRLVDTNWLSQRLGQSGLVVIELGPQPEYSPRHLPGTLRFDVEHLRGTIDGVGSQLLPADMLARHFSLLGIGPQSMVVLVPGAKIQDATLAALALESLGHARYAVLNGGYDKWAAEGRPLSADLPPVTPVSYPPGGGADTFAVGWPAVLQAVQRKDAVLLDVRPADYYRGEKSDEARAGHIPGAVNRPYTEDVVQTDNYTALRPSSELQQAYEALIPRRDARVIVYCRTGHQASQTFFVLTQLLEYRHVLWYGGSWTEWAARPELPIETSSTARE